MRYTTFIPLETAPNPWCDWLGVCEFDSFHGDNREFDMWSDDFRTRSDVYVTWDYRSGEPNGLHHDPQTGVTIGYLDGEEVATDKAPTSDMKIENEEFHTDWISYSMDLASNIPILKAFDKPIAPAIDAEYDAKVYKNGDFEFSGTHDQAPSHEMYMMQYSSDWGFPIHQHEHQDFKYLFPPFPNCEWKISVINNELVENTQSISDDGEWERIGEDLKFTHISDQVSYSGGDFKAQIWGLSANDTNKTFKLYEYDPDNDDDYVGECTVTTNAYDCIWEGIDDATDGPNEKAELYLKTEAGTNVFAAVFYEDGWSKVGSSSEFTDESDRISVAEGQLKASISGNLSGKKTTFYLYEYDPDNSDDYVGRCTVSNDPYECVWEINDSNTDGPNELAELYLLTYSTDGPFSVSFQQKGDSWEKIGEDLEFTTTSDRVSSNGGNVKVNFSGYDASSTITFQLYEYDPDNGDDHIGECTVTGTKNSCNWKGIDVDGSNNKAELYILTNSTDCPFSAVFFD
ncbi:DUF3238 domain-containing protein [Mechercharimyces sp. CAU 1602]|nr:DUF3238 domain-containing protein [Mechercharimyces sp. CAU 1602]